MTYYQCPHCNWTTPTPVEERELPVHHACKGVDRWEDMVPTDAGVKALEDLLLESVEKVIQDNCTTCPSYKEEICIYDKGCKQCKTPKKWRRAIMRGRRCPKGIW